MYTLYITSPDYLSSFFQTTSLNVFFQPKEHVDLIVFLVSLDINMGRLQSFFFTFKPLKLNQ